MVTIKKADFEDYEIIKNLMLRALKEDNDAFSVTYEEYAENSEFWWSSYVTPFTTGLNQEMYIAFDEDKPIGMVGSILDRKEKKKHGASLVWFYVAGEMRGQGIGKQLMNYFFDEIKKKEGVIKVSLSVNETQKKALEIYEKLGFEKNGVLKKELKVGDKFYDVFVLEKFI